VDEIDKKQELILNYEEQFANQLASYVIAKPKLTLWIILIPIFIVFYIMQLQKCVNGRRNFAEHYILDKKRALGEAVEIVRTGRDPDIKKLADLSDAPESTRKERTEVLSVLVEHFKNLLLSDGEDFDSLVRSVYNDRTNYLLFLNRLSKAEKKFNKAIKPHLKEEHSGINGVVDAMELESEKLRRESAERIFP
jgi:predicted transposase YbfD/YdcC